MCLSAGKFTEPFYLGQCHLPVDNVPQRLMFHALLFGLLQALRHNISDVHVYGYNGPMIQQVRRVFAVQCIVLRNAKHCPVYRLPCNGTVHWHCAIVEPALCRSVISACQGLAYMLKWSMLCLRR